MGGKLLLFGLLSYFVYSISAVNILVLEEVPSPSHHIWFRSLNKGLASKGYNVTALSPDKDESSTNLHYIHMDRVYDSIYDNDQGEELNFVDMGSQSALDQMAEYSKYTMLMCEGHVASSGWKQLENYPKDFKFDLIIYDYITGGCLIAFANKFKNVPIIGATAFNDNFRSNSLAGHAVVPALSAYSFVDSDPKTFLGRTFNFLLHMADRISVDCYIIPKVTAVIRESSSFKDSPTMLELGAKSLIFFTNYDPSVDGIQQLPPNVIPVGGLQIKPANRLPEDLQSVADGATNGLILFSLGTNVQGEMLGVERITMILEAFRKLPKYTFLWKINIKESPIPLPANVVLRKWLPQNDILGHKNTKLFITHAGLLSTQESIYHGVPMLGVPIFADQFINIRRSVARGFADVLYVKDLSTELLYTKLNNLLTQPKYRESVKLASATFRDQKETPLERALWWVDWVIRNPKINHFRSEHELNFLQVESFDVIAFVTTVLLVIVFGFVWLMKTLLRLIFGNRKSGKNKID
ncbi:hypothetical protein HA402_003069 [Bradysia odoriphaga]|nr:hypothetical protein HA402_003069 [Bradysia odoriphaga]